MREKLLMPPVPEAGADHLLLGSGAGCRMTTRVVSGSVPRDQPVSKVIGVRLYCSTTALRLHSAAEEKSILLGDFIDPNFASRRQSSSATLPSRPA